MDEDMIIFYDVWNRNGRIFTLGECKKSGGGRVREGVGSGWRVIG